MKNPFTLAQDKYKAEVENFEKQKMENELKKAQTEHPEEAAYQAVGIILRDRKGEYSLDNRPIKDILQLFAGQKVKLVIYHADVEV